MLIIHDSRKVVILSIVVSKTILGLFTDILEQIQLHKKFSFFCSVNKLLVHLPKHISHARHSLLVSAVWSQVVTVAMRKN
jgi:hypothetical protein